MLRWITCGVKEWWYPIPIYDRYNWFWAARPRCAWSTSRSVRPGGSASGRRRRMSAGTTASMNASSDSYPSVASIPRVSSGLGPMWRVTKRSAGAREARTVDMDGRRWLLLTRGCATARAGARPPARGRRPASRSWVRCQTASLRDVLLVRLAGEQLIDVRCVLHLQLDHPSRAVGIAVHERRIAFEGRVHFGDRARHRRVQLRHGLHRLDGAEYVPSPEGRAHLGEVDVDDVAELSLGVVGDADMHDRTLARTFDVLMIFAVTQVGRNVRHARSLARGAWEVAAKVTGARNPCQPNGLPDGNRSDRGARPAAPGSITRNPPQPPRRRASPPGPR